MCVCVYTGLWCIQGLVGCDVCTFIPCCGAFRAGRVWCCGRISKRTVWQEAESSWVASAREQNSIDFPSTDRIWSPAWRAPHLHKNTKINREFKPEPGQKVQFLQLKVQQNISVSAQILKLKCDWMKLKDDKVVKITKFTWNQIIRWENGVNIS